MLAARSSLFYVGGMFLNDAFDRNIDARIIRSAPSPAARSARARCSQSDSVFSVLPWVSAVAHLLRGGAGGIALLGAGAALACCIVLYDSWHKGNF